MSSFLFGNSKATLAFAAVIIGGAMLFAGSEGAMGGYERAESEPEADQAVEVKRVSQNDVKPRPQQPQPYIGDFAPDEDLIDRTEGIDPSSDFGGEIVSSSSSDTGDYNPRSNSDSASASRPTPHAPRRGWTGRKVSIPKNAVGASDGNISVR